MIISENSFSFSVVVTPNFLDFLSENRIFTYRGGLNRRVVAPFSNRFKVDDLLVIKKNSCIEPFSTFSSGRNLFSQGSFSSVASSLPVKTTVGRYSSIGQNVKMVGFRHPVEAVTTSSACFNFCRENISSYFEYVRLRDGKELSPKAVCLSQKNEQPIVIGNDVWIGSDVTLSGGISIGDGSVVAAGSLVTKNVEPYTIVGGTPAKFIKYRFPMEVCAELMKIKWWEYELADLYDFDFSKPTAFVEEFYRKESDIRKTQLKKIDIDNFLKNEILR